MATRQTKHILKFYPVGHGDTTQIILGRTGKTEKIGR